MKKPITHAGVKVLLSVLMTCWVFIVLPHDSIATMNELTDGDLNNICGTGGIAFGLKDIQIVNVIDSFQYHATDGGYVEFKPFVVSGSNGLAYSLNYDFGTTITPTGIIYFNISTEKVADPYTCDLSTWAPSSTVSPTWESMASISVPSWDQDIVYTIGHLNFSDGTTTYNLGEVDIGPVHEPSSFYYFAPHPGSGIDFEYDFKMQIDQISYTVNNTAKENLTFSNIYIGKSISGDPTTPSAWDTTNMGLFKIGDMFGNLTTGSEAHSNPATYDVGASQFNGNLYAAERINLPMEGSMRFEKVDFGGTDFGPGAIDNIKSYRFNVYLVP
jgi:hypothetical protein